MMSYDCLILNIMITTAFKFNKINEKKKKKK